MPTVTLTDEEIVAAIRYFSNPDLRSYMDGRGNNGVRLPMADSILMKLKSPQPDPKPVPKKGTNPRVDAIWNATVGTAGSSNS